MSAQPYRPESLAPGHPLLSAGRNVFLANRARLQIKPFSWFAANSSVLLLLTAVCIAGGVTVVFKPLIGISILLSGVVVGFVALGSARKKYMMGAVCPGVILDAERGLVAVFADMKAASGTFHPAIKIVKQPLHRFAAEEIYDGMRVAAVAQFHGSASRAVWKDISPEVIGCVIRSDELVMRALESIPDEQWQAMDVYLARVTERDSGLYPLWFAAGDAATPGSAPQRRTSVEGLAALKLSLGLIAVFVVIYPVISKLGSFCKKWTDNFSATVATDSIAPAENPSADTVEASPKPTSVIPPSAPEHGMTNIANFAVGQSVSAYWDGRWIKASVVENVRGGAIVRVKLDDPKFRHPVVVAADQVRAQ